MHTLYPIVLNLKQSLQRVQNDWFCAKVISFNTKRCCCGPLNAACRYISSPFSHLRPKIFTEKEDVFSNIWNMRFMTHKKEKKRTSSFNFCDGSSAVICLRLYCQRSSVGNFYTRHAFFFFLNIWLRTVVSVIYSLFVGWASRQLLPIYELLCFCRCEWQLVKRTCHKGSSKILQAAHENFLRDSIKSHHFLFSFFTYRDVCCLAPATLWYPAFLAS